jgi:hypothetical protein
LSYCRKSAFGRVSVGICDVKKRFSGRASEGEKEREKAKQLLPLSGATNSPISKNFFAHCVQTKHLIENFTKYYLHALEIVFLKLKKFLKSAQ